jgi:peptidoglycan/xylan/chitin deacetylase (PgdA/CDA1 family)
MAAGKADRAGCSGIVPPDRPRFGGRVALTFDDGPNPATTPQVLEVLRAHGVPATFFINGKNVSSEATEAIVADVVADPLFHLGNHSWSHPNMTTLSAGTAADQIDDNTAVIEAAGGEPTYFRFPFGSANCSLAQAVRDRGYKITGWHVDSADWCFSTGTPGSCPASRFKWVDDDVRNDMLGFVMRQVRQRDGGIVLFHDIHQYTADSLERVIETMEDEGFTFVGLDDTDTFPLLNGVTPPAPEPPADGVPAHVVDDISGLWMREGPGTGFDHVTLMPPGAAVQVLEGPEDGWYQVWYDGDTGWASGDFLDFDN